MPKKTIPPAGLAGPMTRAPSGLVPVRKGPAGFDPAKVKGPRGPMKGVAVKPMPLPGKSRGR